MTNLTPAQQTTLEAAASRADGSIHPLPDHIKGGAARSVTNALRTKGLINNADHITTLGHCTVDPDWTESEQTNETIEAMEQPVDEDSPTTSEAPLDLGTDEGAAACSANMPEADKAFHEEMNAASDEPDGPEDYDDPPQSLLCPMDPADLPQTKTDIEPADGDFEDDVTAAEQALAQANEQVPEIIEAIAKRYIQETGFRTTRENLEKVLIEAFKAGQKASAAPKTKTPRENSKQARMIAMLRRPEGATIEQISEMTDWSSNTIRGAISGALKKRLGLNVVVINRLRNVGPNAKGGYSTYQIQD